MSSLHREMGQRAYELLPERYRRFWEEESGNIPEYCEYPDLHQGSQWEEPEKEPFYARYCVMENGKAAPHGPPDRDWNGATFGGDPDLAKLYGALEYYLKRTVENIASGNVADSARFAGTGAHVIQDCGNPGHTFNNITLNRLFPPRGDKIVFMHRIMDAWPIDLAAVKTPPRLLGRTVSEAVYFLGERIVGNMRLIAADMVKLCQGIIAGRKKSVSVIMQKWNAAAIRNTADFWYTAFVLASGKLPGAAARGFGPVMLADHPLITAYDDRFDRLAYVGEGIPFYKNAYPECDPPRSTMSTDPYPFEPAVNRALTASGEWLPLRLKASGKLLTGKGIASGTYGVATWYVPGNVFRTFEATAGIHPDSPADVEAVFGVWCCESIPHLLSRGTVTRDGGVIRFKVALPPECRTLSLLNAGGDGKSSSVWLNPVLRA